MTKQINYPTDLRFPVKKWLTERLNMKGWIIYRDPQVGLYALNEKMGIEVNLDTWNVCKSYDEEYIGQFLFSARETIKEALEEETR